jgi:hypothetical protein
LIFHAVAALLIRHIIAVCHFARSCRAFAAFSPRSALFAQTHDAQRLSGARVALAIAATPFYLFFDFVFAIFSPADTLARADAAITPFLRAFHC